MFNEILTTIHDSEAVNFDEVSARLEQCVDSDSDFVGTLDVIAESRVYGYSMVSDAKAFRLSRTAKNQKDFKVSALSAWRRDNDYAVLCAPYFQYPAKTSQIYSQALSNNVCLLSWEHLIFMIERGVKESQVLNIVRDMGLQQ